MNQIFFEAKVVPLGKTDQGHSQGLGAFNVFCSWAALCLWVLVLKPWLAVAQDSRCAAILLYDADLAHCGHPVKL